MCLVNRKDGLEMREDFEVDDNLVQREGSNFERMVSRDVEDSNRLFLPSQQIECIVFLTVFQVDDDLMM